MNIIVKGAKTLIEYKLLRAAITKMAIQLSEKWGHPTPETAWLEEGLVHIVYPDGSRWILSEKEAIKEEDISHIRKEKRK